MPKLHQCSLWMLLYLRQVAPWLVLLTFLLESVQVAIMIFLGFGFLMTFLKRYSYSALGLNFFCSCVVILEAVLVIGAVQQVMLSAIGSTAFLLPFLVLFMFTSFMGIEVFQY